MEQQAAALEAEQQGLTPAPEAGLSSQEPPEQDANEAAAEAEAREWGWVPKTDFKGDPARWKPASQWIEDGHRILPAVRGQLKREQERRATEKAEFDQRIARMERMASENMKRAQAQHASELERVRLAQREAAESGDLNKFDALEKQRETLNATRFEEAPQVGDNRNEQLANYQRAVGEFTKQHSWYGTDGDLTAFADGYSAHLAQQNPSITLEDNLRQVVAKVRATFPQKFQSAHTNGHAAVDGGGFGARPAKSTLASKLPSEARQQAERDVKEGLYKSVDDWAAVYYGK